MTKFTIVPLQKNSASQKHLQNEQSHNEDNLIIYPAFVFHHKEVLGIFSHKHVTLLAILLCYRLVRLFVVFTSLVWFRFERERRGIPNPGTTNKVLYLDCTAPFGNNSLMFFNIHIC